MSENRMKPRYILLSTPTLKYSRSIHDHHPNAQSFEAPSLHKQESLHHIHKQKAGSIRDSSISKNLNTIKQELNQTMQTFAIEQKKNSTLKELNTLLERSNRQSQNRQKLQIKPQIQREKRLLEKEEYEIDQIQQKYNEEVARIIALRQQVNSARTDRVVYSALFKKIQMEIKHYEKLYEEQVVKTEFKIYSKQTQPKPSQPAKQESVDEFQNREDADNRKSRIGMTFEAIHHFFMTNPDHKLPKAHGKKTTQRTNQREIQLQAQITAVSGNIERIVKAADCFSFDEVLQFYGNLDRSNTELSHRIEETQWEIEDLEEQIERIRLEKRNSQISEEKHIKKLTNLTIPSSRKLRSCKNIKITDAQENEETPQKILEEVAEALGLSTLVSSMDDLMASIQEVLWGEEKSVKQATCGNPEHCLQVLLQKMQTFEHCERYYSKKQFQGEYLKQVCRQRRHMRIRK